MLNIAERIINNNIGFDFFASGVMMHISIEKIRNCKDETIFVDKRLLPSAPNSVPADHPIIGKIISGRKNNGVSMFFCVTLDAKISSVIP